MTTIHFIRHGEVDNPTNVMYGRKPGFPLSEIGRQTISKLASTFSQSPIAAIYSSPLLRTRQTAGILQAATRAPIIEDDRLLEIEVSRANQGFSEPTAVIGQRMEAFIYSVIKEYPDQTVIAVSHGVPIQILRLTLRGLDPVKNSDTEEMPRCGEDTVVNADGDRPPLLASQSSML